MSIMKYFGYFGYKMQNEHIAMDICKS